MLPDAVAWDTCVLLSPFDRRFIMAVCELRGCKTNVAPQVAKELFGLVPVSESDYWHRVLDGEEARGERQWPLEQRQAICRAASEGAKEWIKKDVDAQPANSALSLVTFKEADSERIRILAEEIPASCFRGPSKDGHRGDRHVIAQAAVAGLQVLATKIRSSIKHEQMNEWCASSLGTNAQLVREADSFVQSMTIENTKKAGVALRPEDIEDEMLSAILLAALPSRQVSTKRLDEIVTRFIDQVADQSFPDCADDAAKAWASDRSPAVVERVQPMLPTSLARTTEQRRVDEAKSPRR